MRIKIKIINDLTIFYEKDSKTTVGVLLQDNDGRYEVLHADVPYRFALVDDSTGYEVLTKEMPYWEM